MSHVPAGAQLLANGQRGQPNPSPSGGTGSAWAQEGAHCCLSGHCAAAAAHRVSVCSWVLEPFATYTICKVQVGERTGTGGTPTLLGPQGEK